MSRIPRAASLALSGAVLLLSGCALQVSADYAGVPESDVGAGEDPVPVPEDLAGAADEGWTLPGSRYSEELASDVLRSLTVQEPANPSVYSAEAFGDSWLDLDGDGCDTWEQILARDLTKASYAEDGPDCRVAGGELEDAYTGRTATYSNGDDDATPVVELDRLVSLEGAWTTGAQDLDPAERSALANDPLNLQATAAETVAEKSGGLADAWLPPNEAYRCIYVARQISVKRHYGLWVTDGERSAMAEVLESCPSQRAFEPTVWSG